MNVLTQTLDQWDVAQGQFLRGETAGLNTEFSFFYSGCRTNPKEPNLPNYLSIAAEVGTEGFMPFQRAFEWNETPTASSSIWTQIALSIYYDNNYYVTSGLDLFILLLMSFIISLNILLYLTYLNSYYLVIVFSVYAPQTCDLFSAKSCFHILNKWFVKTFCIYIFERA